MCSNFDKFQVEINKIREENKKLKKEINNLKQGESNLDKRLQRIEQFAAKYKQENNENNMIITNMPKFDKEVDLKNVVSRIATQVQYILNQEEIIDVYQFNNKKRDTFPIIVKLKTNELKKKCMEFRKSKKTIDIKAIGRDLNNNNKNINFYHLIEKEYADLLNKAKDNAKKKHYKYVWYTNSTVLVRKDDQSEIIKIRTNDDLKNIK